MARAYALFGGAVILLSAIAGQLAFREVGVSVLTKRLDLVHREADKIVEAVWALAGEGRSVNFARLRERQDELRNLIHECFARRRFIHHVSIHDRFGVLQFNLFRESIARPALPLDRGETPQDWPIESEQIVRATLGSSEGEVRVALAAAPVLEELTQLRRTLQIKVAVAGGLALIVLVGGFLYVLHLIRKTRTLEQSRESAARAAYVGLLASGLAHEIRNPLNSMNMNLQMLEEELAGMPSVDRAEWGELLDSTKSEIKRLERLVNNFLAYARPSRPHFEPHDLNVVTGELLRFLEADFRQSGVTLKHDFEPLLPSVELDVTQFKQALINLLVNARQVLQGGGSVTVRTRPGQGGEVVLEIEDDGPGIPVEARERIFEVFYSSRGGGTGLGLPIARQIVERHGGTIEIESEESKGTIFRIRLPRQQPTDQGAQGRRPRPA